MIQKKGFKQTSCTHIYVIRSLDWESPVIIVCCCAYNDSGIISIDHGFGYACSRRDVSWTTDNAGQCKYWKVNFLGVWFIESVTRLTKTKIRIAKKRFRSHRNQKTFEKTWKIPFTYPLSQIMGTWHVVEIAQLLQIAISPLCEGLVAETVWFDLKPIFPIMQDMRCE